MTFIINVDIPVFTHKNVSFQKLIWTPFHIVHCGGREVVGTVWYVQRSHLFYQSTIPQVECETIPWLDLLT